MANSVSKTWDATAMNGLPPYLTASTRIPTAEAVWMPRPVTGVPDTLGPPMQFGRTEAPHAGCVCPAGANKDCENPMCPRKPRDYASMKAT